MAISYTDAYGAALDTGAGTQPTLRANTEIETHGSNEVDTGSKLSTTQLLASHVPHRPANSPR